MTIICSLKYPKTQISNENTVHKVSLDVAKLSKLAADACEAEEEEVEILLPKVNGTILQKVLDFCEHHEKVEAS